VPNRETPTNRPNTTPARPHGWLRASTLASLTGATPLDRELLKRRSTAVLGAVILAGALSLFFAGCDHKSKIPARADDGTFVMDDFESGALTDWRVVGSGSGGWFAYTNGRKAPDPAQSDPNIPFDLPDPPQGKFAAVSDMNGPGTLILYRDVKLDGRFRLHLTVFHAGAFGFSSPPTLAYDEPEDNQQFRIDLVAPSAPIDSVAQGDVLVNVFKTSTSELYEREPTAVKVDVSHWAGQPVRLRLAVTANRGPLRVGVDDIRFEPIGSDADARIELPDTEEPSRALYLALHRLTEADALKTLSARAAKLAGEGEFAGAVLVAKDGHVLFSHAYGLANRKRGTANTLRTRFRIGSMNKMFTGVAILQLVEAGKLQLTAPLGKYLTDYPNRDVATKVTIHQLLTHTGGTGDIFGPDFDLHRTELRSLADYVQLYGKRGLEFEPGSRWAYSNYGFILLGRVIEEVTRQSYYDYVRQHIYKPAGMTRSGSLPEDQAVPGRSIGYMKPPGATVCLPNTDWLPYRGTSAGGGYSTVEDLARFADALLSHKLLSPDSTELLVTGKVKARPGARYAYGFEDARDGDGNGWVGHGGGAPGMNGDLRIYPKSGYVIAVLANIDPPAAQRISEYLDPRLPAEG
jgi:CubicO group peptidase (beta-lactamase class C family)